MKPHERRVLHALQQKLAAFREKLAAFGAKLEAVDPPLTDTQRWQVERAAEDTWAPDLDEESRRLKGAQGRN